MADAEYPILVLTQEDEDERHLRRLLVEDFDDLHFYAFHEAVEQWLKIKPRVVVLVGNSLGQSEKIYKAMLEADAEAEAGIAHRSLLICQLEEAEDAYDLCVDQVVDDYIVFKPLHDAWRIRLCVWHGLALPARVRSTDASAGSGKKKARRLPTIMVVEDDPFTRDVYEDILEANDYRPVLVDDGSNALTAIEEVLPNVIIMDIDMPGLNGIQATRQLRADPRTKGVPIIFASGHRDKKTVEEAIKAGANGYIIKPINQEKLLEKIRQNLPFER